MIRFLRFLMPMLLVVFGGLHSGASLDAGSEALLETQLEQAKSQDPELAKLLAEAVRQSGKPNVHEFLTILDWCADSRDHAGLTQSQLSQVFYYFNRELEEPSDLNSEQLQAYYLPKIEKNLPANENTKLLHWAFRPDFYVLTKFENKRSICLRKGMPSDLLLEFLVHEMVHYARVPAELSTFETQLELDPLAYSRRMILQPGDEADAYLFQYSFVVRHDGKKRLAAPIGVARFWDEKGLFWGRREDLVLPILEDLGYFKKRFRDEYERVLARQVQTKAQVLNFARQLLKARQSEVTEFADTLAKRSVFLNWVWPAYKKQTQSLEALIAKNEKSQTSLQALIREDFKQCHDLRALARNQLVPLPSCEGP